MHLETLSSKICLESVFSFPLRHKCLNHSSFHLYNVQQLVACPKIAEYSNHSILNFLLQWWAIDHTQFGDLASSLYVVLLSSSLPQMRREIVLYNVRDYTRATRDKDKHQIHEQLREAGTNEWMNEWVWMSVNEEKKDSETKRRLQVQSVTCFSLFISNWSLHSLRLPIEYI